MVKHGKTVLANAAFHFGREELIGDEEAVGGHSQIGLDILFDLFVIAVGERRVVGCRFRRLRALEAEDG